MKLFKLLLSWSLIASLVSCGQSFSDKEKELLGETVKEAVADANKTETPVVENTASYKLPFCNLLSEADIKKVFLDATDFSMQEGKEKVPECEITFASGEMMPGMKNPAGIIIKGFLPRKGEPARTFLERTMAGRKDQKKIEGLGDEAYLFPNDSSPFVVLVKGGLSYSLRLNRVETGNNEMAVKLMEILASNIE